MKGTRAYQQRNQSDGYNVVDFYFIICFCCLCSPFALCIMSTCAYACERCSCQLKFGKESNTKHEKQRKKEASLIMPGASFCFWRPSKEFSFHYFNVYERFIWTWTRYVAFSLPALLLAKRIILPKSHTLLLRFLRFSSENFHFISHTGFLCLISKTQTLSQSARECREK